MDNLKIKEHFPHDVCPECGAASVPLEGVPDQSGRGCPMCEMEWFEDLSKTPAKPTYGGPLLSPYTSEQVMTGKFGRLQVRALPETDTFGLLYLANELEDRPALTRGWTLLACHPNGHSCKDLAQRILAAWEGKGDGARAVDQFDFILRCGGLGRSLETILAVIRGQY